VGGLYVIAAGTLFYVVRGWLEKRNSSADVADKHR
jgi:hypothetical protein